MNENLDFVLGRVENIVGKGENAGYQHFLLFPQCFPNPSVLGSLKVGIVRQRVNRLPKLGFILHVMMKFCSCDQGKHLADNKSIVAQIMIPLTDSVVNIVGKQAIPAFNNLSKKTLLD